MLYFIIMNTVKEPLFHAFQMKLVDDSSLNLPQFDVCLMLLRSGANLSRCCTFFTCRLLWGGLFSRGTPGGLPYIGRALSLYRRR